VLINLFKSRWRRLIQIPVSLRNTEQAGSKIATKRYQ
jgi:hypothetical protein